MKSRWSDADARQFSDRYAPRWGEALALRVYTSRLIGAESDLVMHGGGNTSVKVLEENLLGDRVEALCIKGSGWDLDSIEPQGFPAIDLGWLRRLRKLTALSDEEMVNQLRTHLLDAKAPNPSVETLLHAFLPHTFIDHTHADAVLALTNQPDGAGLIREALGDRVVVVPYVMPGFRLAKLAAEMFEGKPDADGMVLLKHGLFTFAADARASYERMIEYVDRAEGFLRARLRGRGSGGAALGDGDAARARMGQVGPILRGLLASASGNPDQPHRCMIRMRSARSSPRRSHVIGLVTTLTSPARYAPKACPVASSIQIRACSSFLVWESSARARRARMPSSRRTSPSTHCGSRTLPRRSAATSRWTIPISSTSSTGAWSRPSWARRARSRFRARSRW